MFVVITFISATPVNSNALPQITSQIQCIMGVSLSNTECTSYLCSDFATLSQWHYIIVQNQEAEGSHEHISGCIKISVVQSVMGWLVSYKLQLIYRDITLDKRFVVAVLHSYMVLYQ